MSKKPNETTNPTKVILPMAWGDIQNPDCSVIVVDAKGDQTAPVVEMAKKARGDNARILYLSFSEPDKSLAQGETDE